MKLYRIKPLEKHLFSRKYEVLSLDGTRLAQITQSASEYDTIVTSEGKRYLVGGDIDINLWMECPDGKVYETRIPDEFRIGYTYFINFDRREILLKGKSIYENNTLIGEIKKEPIKWPKGILNKIKTLFSLREWALEIKDDIPEDIALFIIWIFLTVELKSGHGEGRELKTLTLEKERNRFKRISIKETGENDKLMKIIKILIWLWFIIAVVSGIILGLNFSLIAIEDVLDIIFDMPGVFHALYPLISLIMEIFLLSVIFFVPLLVLFLLIKFIVYQLKKT